MDADLHMSVVVFLFATATAMLAAVTAGGGRELLPVPIGTGRKNREG